MFLLSAWYVLPLAFILDLLIGDLQRFPHPVRLMGRAITTFEPKFRKLPFSLPVCGLLFTICLISCTFIFSLIIIQFFSGIHPFCGSICEVIFIYYCISARTLQKDSMEVADTLENEGLEPSKDKLKYIVGRDVKSLTETGVSRATVETVAENLVDGVISPLFYAALLGAPFALVFKMINTLDSMVGYKNEKYIDFGKASAQIDDVMNYIPARLSVFVIALSANLFRSGTGKDTLRNALEDGQNHASPNAGYPEAAFSGALKIKLGGPNMYHGKQVDKPYIGEAFGDVRIGHVKMACDLMMLSSFIWFIILWGIHLVIR